jgi:DNA polymerase-3 subunit alpha
MVKIVSRRSLGEHAVYDIGVAQDHNFVLANGLVASNCFNKSHSTAYGYVTFQTAYLKANFPTEYMAALITANSGDQDKVQKYISTCMSMGIRVDPPDINRSQVNFTPIQDRILFGLSAVRNVGQGAIAHILEARNQNGSFQSLGDLCDRIDTHVVNRRALEALIQAGALDPIEPNRHQLMADLELVLDWAQSRARDRASGQGNLFDLLGGAFGSTEVAPTNSFDAIPKAPLVEDFPPQEKLRLEKELLGFYVSDHPLKSVQEAAKVLAPINLSDLEEYVDRGLVSAIVMIASIKPVTTKKGDRMAIVQLEDLTGQSEAVVFAKTYARVEPHIQPDTRLMIWGKVGRRDDQVQLVIEDVEPIEAVKMLMIDLPPQQANDIQAQHQLKTLLLEHRGEDDQAKVPVVAVIHSATHREFVRLGAQFRVLDAQQAAQHLQQAGYHARSTALA